MRVGEPVDHGTYGELTGTEDGRLTCHLCGESWKHLATHARRTHQLSAAEYRDRYGLPATLPLVGTSTQVRMREAWDAHADQHRAALDAHRDPGKAYRASRASQGSTAQWAPAVRAKRQQITRARRGPDLTPTQVAVLGDGIDLQAWADGARTLQAEGVTLAQLARAADITPATAGQRLRRYPPREDLS